MPNHVHLLVKSYDEHPLSEIVHSWKSFTSHEIKKILRKERESSSSYTGGTPVLPAVWQIEYWDRFVRDSVHFNRAIRYIHENPVKAGLCREVEEWGYSSVNDFKQKYDLGENE